MTKVNTKSYYWLSVCVHYELWPLTSALSNPKRRATFLHATNHFLDVFPFWILANRWDGWNAVKRHSISSVSQISLSGTSFHVHCKSLFCLFFFYPILGFNAHYHAHLHYRCAWMNSTLCRVIGRLAIWVNKELNHCTYWLSNNRLIMTLRV